jgi:hypothetical protein
MLTDVEIESVDQLFAFEDKVQRSPFLSPGSPVICGRLVQHLKIAGYRGIAGNSLAHAEDFTQWTFSVVAVIVACPFLQSFTLFALPVTRASTACLVLASDHLTKISISVNFERFYSDGVFRHIQRLRGLVELHITFITFDAGGVLEAHSLLHMPKLKVLAWVIQSMNEPACDAILRYLSRCRFPSVVEVHLAVMSAFPQLALLLLPFLHAHIMQSLSLVCTDPFIAKIVPQLTRIEELHLPFSSPPLSLLESEQLPSYLTVYCDPNKRNTDTTRFWDGLKRIPSRTARGGKISRLYILTDQDFDNPDMRYGRRFEWTDGAHTIYSAFIGRLMTEAIRLYREGVIIVDGQGRDITELVEKDGK